VNRKVAALGKRLGAGWALERLLLGVCADVPDPALLIKLICGPRKNIQKNCNWFSQKNLSASTWAEQ
jgi:hypothetical protein